MILLYNTLTKQKEEFQSLSPGKVGMYVCGPTVYDYQHIGNFKSFVTSDILRRALEHEGYEVRMIKNITDVGHLTRDDMSQGDTGDDKIAMKAEKEHKSPEEIARFYEDYFHEAEKKMNILDAQYFPRATAHISHIIRCIENLIKNGHAYTVNGNVFYDVTSFSHYGELSGNTLEKLKTGARLEEHPDKRHSWDFALWLKAPEGHLMHWPSPWSEGYPGWHIECSAMSTEYLGDQFDIHTGGEDHIFPHHEAEIAQTEGSTGKRPAVRFWVHTRHMLVDGKKMSKSKGNFYRLEDLEKRGFSAMHLRLALLSAHYRSQMNFTWDALEQGKKNYEKISTFVHKMGTILPCQGEVPEKRRGTNTIQKFQEKFWQAINDDLNTPQALAELYAFITETNKLKDITPDFTKAASQAWKDANSVLGLTLETPQEIPLPEHVQLLVKKRHDARTQKDFAAADKLREEIEKEGFAVEDTANGQKIKKV